MQRLVKGFESDHERASARGPKPRFRVLKTLKETLNLSGVSGDGPYEVFNVAVESLFDACGYVSDSSCDSSEWASDEKILGSLWLRFPWNSPIRGVGHR